MAKALTKAEKQRLYRAKIMADPLRREQEKEKERQRWHKRKEAGKVQSINDLTTRGKRLQRKKWRLDYQNRKLKKSLTEMESCTLENTPPTSPVLDEMQHVVSPPTVPDQQSFNGSSSTPSRQKLCGRKMVRKDRAACYRKLSEVTKQLEMEKRRASKYRKQAERARRALEQSQTHKSEEVNEVLTPRKRARHFLRSSTESAVINELAFHYSISENVRKKYKAATRDRKSRQIISKVVASGATLKKYRTIKKVSTEFGISRNIIKSNEGRDLEKYVYQQRKKLMRSSWLKHKVETFFQEDTVSRIASGKKEWCKRGGVKKQKRYLLATVALLHKKFLKEEKIPVSLSKFRMLKPFWVLKPKISNRETCLCKLHENTLLMHKQLKRLGYVKETCPDVTKLVCDINAKKCCYRECLSCKNVQVVFENPHTDTGNNDETTWWWQWENIATDYNGKKIQKTVKNKVNGTVADLKQIYDKNMTALIKHEFNIQHQYKECKKKKETMEEDEAFIHVDFSENWTIKGLRMIQSAHFGGSNSQITLHTGVAYIGGKTDPVSFCSLSNNNAHTPSAIWDHLNPVLQMLQRDFPKIEKLHFLSDGPVTQYKGRANLYLMSSIPYSLGFQQVWWNFSEASHGKGAADGVGAVVKRLADAVVLEGKEITNAHTLFLELVDRTKVKLFYISDEASTMIPPTGTLPAVKGIMQVHQVYSNRPWKICVRDVSCYCQANFCNCFSPVWHNMRSTEQPRVEAEIHQDGTEMSSQDNTDQLVSSSDTQSYKPSPRKNNESSTPSYLVPIESFQAGAYVKVTYGSQFLAAVVDEWPWVRFSKKNSDKWVLNTIKYTVSCSDVVKMLVPPVVIRQGRRIYYSFNDEELC